MKLELGGILDPQIQRNFQLLDGLLIDTGSRSVGLRFGTQVVSWAAAGTSATATGISHGLGKTPVVIIAGDLGGDNWIAAPETGSYTDTTFAISVRTADNTAPGVSSNTIGWVAIG